MTYCAEPCYPPIGHAVLRGWAAAVAELPAPPFVLAVDGPAALAWDRAIADLVAALALGDRFTNGSTGQRAVRVVDMRDHCLPWNDILELTDAPGLRNDPNFAALATVGLGEILSRLEPPAVADGVLVVFGPGAALVRHDVLWYFDLPKRFAEAAIGRGEARNLGQVSGTGTTKRLFFIDWPILDRHRDSLIGDVARWFDFQEPTEPRSIDGPTLLRTAEALSARPLRTRPTFNSTPWGGHWAQQRLGVHLDACNTALGYELIAPESGVLVGTPSDRVEVPFQLIVGYRPREVLGDAVHAEFGTSFPIRFDYLDTVGGGNLSVHCHPRSSYMQEVFGWPYTQHETYYVFVGGEGAKVYLGLREGIDVEAFRARARDADERGVPFDIAEFVQAVPAVPHQLLMIPAGTPHGSGDGNVVLEVSATPYLYSLRFYDWLRRHDGRQRPVHVDHAFANLDVRRQGAVVQEELIQPVRVLRSGEGWHEELLGSDPEMFFEVRRLVSTGQAIPDDTQGRFHVLTVVEGDRVTVETDDGHRHELGYAETMVIPAAVGPHLIHPARSSSPVRVVKALVSAAATRPAKRRPTA